MYEDEERIELNKHIYKRSLDSDVINQRAKTKSTEFVKLIIAIITTIFFFVICFVGTCGLFVLK